MIDSTHKLSLTKQAKVLGISPGSVYYRPRPVTDTDLGLMRRIDELHLDYPLAGNRMLRGLLLVEGYKVRRLQVRTLMKRMGIEAIYRRPNTSKPEFGHKIYPCLLRKLPVIRPNQVSLTGMKRTLPGNGAMDITYIPIKRGFVYLAAVIDWLIRRVLSWRLSITLKVNSCIEAAEEALAWRRKPDIFNTDQGSKFTSISFTEVLKDAETFIPMPLDDCLHSSAGYRWQRSLAG